MKTNLRTITFLAAACLSLTQPVKSLAQAAPQIWMTGSATGSEVYYPYGTPMPALRQLFSPTVNEDVATEAQNLGTVIREGAILGGSYHLSASLPAGELGVSAVAPAYAYYYYFDGFGRLNQMGLEGYTEASVSYNKDQITVFGPFAAGTQVRFVIRARLHGTMQSGPAGQGYGGKESYDFPNDDFTPPDVIAPAQVLFGFQDSTGAENFNHSTPRAAGSPLETIEHTNELLYFANAISAGQTPPAFYGGGAVQVQVVNGASVDFVVSLEIILPRGYSYSSLMGTQMKVVYVNAQPSFTSGGDVAAPANSGPQTIPNWATDIDPGAPDESGQTLSFLVTGNSNPALFDAGPSISPDGTLSFTPTAGMTGSAEVTVILKDDGGTTLDGVDTSLPHTFTIRVENHPPIADAGGPYTINQGSVLALNGSTSHDPDPGDSLTFSWDLNDDGTFGDATGATPIVTPAWLTSLGLGAGAHTIRLRVTGLAGASDTASTTLTIRGTQMITIEPIGVRVLGIAPFTMFAWADSGLPVTFTSLTPSVATVSGDTVTIVSTGAATIRASQAGDANWQPAPDVEQTFEVWDRSSLWAWGVGLDGRLGNGVWDSSSVPVPVAAPPAWAERSVVTVAIGGGHSLALLDDGSVWAWGYGSDGQLGNGQTVESRVPGSVSAPVAWNGRTVVSVEAGSSHSLAVLDDGTVWAWGNGGYGQLGNGQAGNSPVPVAVSAPAAWNGHTVVSVAAGTYHSVALLDDGSVWAWGWGFHGQLGHGQTASSSVPVAVSAPAAWNGRTVVKVAAGSNHSLAVLDDGSIWAWGYGGSGQLGNGQTGNSSVPVSVSAPAAWAGHPVATLAAGDNHTLVVLDDGSLWGWGQNNLGQLGDGQTGNSSIPRAMSPPAAWNGHTVVSVAAGFAHSLAVLDDGAVWAWGWGANGELGHGYFGNSSVPVAVSAPTAWNGHRVVNVAAGGENSLALLEARNSAPVVANPIASQNATYGAAFSFTLPANTFSDADTGHTLSYSASGLPAWLSFDAETRTFSGTPAAVGTFDLTVTATDDGTPALSAGTSFDLVVGKAALAARGDTLYRFYGEENPPLTGTLEGVVNGDNITASYMTWATPASPPAAYTILVTLQDPEHRLGNYEVTNINGLLHVQRAPQAMTFEPIADYTYGDAPFAISATANSGLPVTFTSLTPSVATVTGNTVTIVGAGTATIRASQAGDANWQPAPDVDRSFSVSQAPPTVANPIADSAVYEDSADTVIDLRGVFSDLETADEDLVYSVQANNNSSLLSATVDDTTDTLILHYAANRFGAATITVGATDAGGLSVEDTFVVTVTQVSDGDPGDVDPGLGLSVDGDVYGVAVQRDGKILLGGRFSSVGGAPRRFVARLNADGTLDPGFSASPNSQVHGILVQPDGKIVLRGSFTALDGATRSQIARINADGSVDAGFNAVVGGNLQTVALQPDGKIVVGGSFTALNGEVRNRIARIHPDGTLDLSFNPDANDEIIGVAVQADGKIVIVGRFTTVNGTVRRFIARLNPDGTLDPDLNPNVDSPALCVAVQADGKLIIGGFFTQVAGVRQYFVARLQPDGTLDNGFDPSFTSTPSSIAVQADGRIVIGGQFTLVNGTVRQRLARLHADGTLDSEFCAAVDDVIHGLAMQADGKVLLAGQFRNVGDQPHRGVARLENDPATQELLIPDPSQVAWLRNGASPEVPEVAFEASVDGGTTWTLLGLGSRIAGGWELSGLNLSGEGQVRARGTVLGGYFNGSSGLVQAMASFSFNAVPSVAHAIPNQTATYGAASSFAVPANTFTDPDTGQTLIYSASGLPAWLSFDAETATFSGTPTALGSTTITVTATDNGTPALSASTTFDLVVGKATLTATGDRIHRFYGEANPPLTGTIEGVVNGDNITATYSTTATPSSPASVYTIFVTLNDPDSRLNNYEVTKVNGLLYVDPAPQTITFGAIPPHVHGDAPFTVPVSASSGLPVTLTSSSASVATVSGTTLTITGAGTTLLTAYQFGGGNYQAAPFVQVSYTVGKATPVITWATPAPIDSSTALSAAQLNATANTAGSFSYDPAAGTVLSRGAQNLSVTFTPTDAANYTTASATVPLTVLNSEPVATAQSVTTAEDTAATITLAGTDADADTLTYLVTGNPTHGTLTGTASNVTYTPAADYHGPDSFTFTASDGTGDSAPATVSITVTPVNDAPVAQDDAYTTAENTLLVVDSPGVLDNDTDADAGPMVRFAFAGRVVSPDADFRKDEPFVGSYLVSRAPLRFNGGDATMTYDYRNDGSRWEIEFPDRGYRYVAESAYLWVMVGNDIPVFGDRYIVDGASPVSVGTSLPSGRLFNTWQIDLQDPVSAGADLLTDAGVQTTSINLAAAGNPGGRIVFRDGTQAQLVYDQLVGPLTVTAVNSEPALLNTIFTLPSGTQLRLGSNGSLRYDPNGQFAHLGSGEVAIETFTYTVADAEGVEAGATVTITITGLNATPSAQGQSFTMHDNESAAITLTGSDAETPSLTYRIVSGPTAGSLSGTPPQVVYTPPFPFAGNDGFTFEVEDEEGATVTASVEITILASDRPPVAVAGGDQAVLAGMNCVATVTVDGSGSSDPDGDALSFAWQLFSDGEWIDTVANEAVVSWDLNHGLYEALLTVAYEKNGMLVSDSDSLMIEVPASAPVLDALSPAAAYAAGPGFNLTVTGGCFRPGAAVHWNGEPRSTTVMNPGELVAIIPAADLNTGVAIAVATVQVVNGDGKVSPALGFSIVAQTVGTADAAVAEAGETSTVSTAPTTSGEPGVTVTVQNNGGQPVTVLAAAYDEKPVGETAFRVDNGSFVDVQVAGADENVAALVFFYYPSTVTGGMENRVKLRYFDGANWIPVLNSGGLPPAKDTTDNLDSTVSGGRFSVVFDATSTPTIMELGGTVFGMFESEPQLGAITGPSEPVAIGSPISVSASFAVVGDPADATVHLVWDDGTETLFTPDTTTATAWHLYTAPGVYVVTVQVADGQGDAREGRFEYVVVYDPDGGFVTGGGWIESAAGAYLYDLTLTGKASFGFNSKYVKGRTMPSGDTQFQFQAGDFKFHSTSYDWLVVSGAKAQYKGVGRVSGAGDYGFLLTANDGQLTGGGGYDKFRIKIWDRGSGVVVYDNRRGTSDDMDQANPQVIGGGSIVIHKSR